LRLLFSFLLLIEMRRSFAVGLTASSPVRCPFRPIVVVSFAPSGPSRNLNWQRVVNKWTSKNFIDTWRKLETEINTLKFTARSLPTEVPPIDWASWKKKIEAPGVVDEMQREYETKEFAPEKANFEETDRYIDKMEQWYTVLREFSQKKIVMLEAKLEELYEERSTVGWWTTADVFFKFPGLQDQLELRAGVIRGNKNRYTPHTRIAVFDFSDARRALKEGRKPEGLPPPLRSVGDFNRVEWDRREQREISWLETEYKRIMEDQPAIPAPTPTAQPSTATPAPKPAH